MRYLKSKTYGGMCREVIWGICINGDEIQWKLCLCSLTGTRLLYIQSMMCYYKENLGDKVVTMKHTIIGISEEIKHDADLAIAFENRPLE